MSILTNSLGYLIRSFKLPEDPKLSKIEEGLLNNIISVAKKEFGWMTQLTLKNIILKTLKKVWELMQFKILKNQFLLQKHIYVNIKNLKRKNEYRKIFKKI